MPTAYSLSATQPLSKTDRKALFRQTQPLHPTSSSSPPTGPASPSSTVPPPSSPIKPGFFRRLAGGGKKLDGGEGGKIPWETSSSPAAFPGSGRRERSRTGELSLGEGAAARGPSREYPRSPAPAQPSKTSDRMPTNPSTPPSPRRRLPSSPSRLSGIHNTKRGTASSSQNPNDDDLSGGEENDGAGCADTKSLSPSRFGSGGRLKSLVKKGSKFSLRSLVNAHTNSHSPPASPTAPFVGVGASQSPQTQSLPLPRPSSTFGPPSPHFSSGSTSTPSHSSRRPSEYRRAPASPPLAPSSSFANSSYYYPREISSPAPPRAPLAQAGGSFLTPLPSPLPLPPLPSPALSPGWILGGAAGGEGKELGKGSVRGKAARLLGEEVVPSGKAARLLGMERKKTLVKTPSAVSLSPSVISYDDDRRPCLSATTTSGGFTSCDSPPCIFSPVPGFDSSSLPSRILRRRSWSDPNLLLTSRTPPSRPPFGQHRNLYEEDDDLWDGEEMAASRSPPTAPGVRELDHALEGEGASETPVTSDYTSPSLSKGFSPASALAAYDFSPGGQGRQISVESPTTPLGHAAVSSASPQHTRMLSTASSTFAGTGLAPSSGSSPPAGGGRFYPFSIPHSSSSSTISTTDYSLPGTNLASRNLNRLSPDSIRFSALGMVMNPEAFSSPETGSVLSGSESAEGRSESPESARTSPRVSGRLTAGEQAGRFSSSSYSSVSAQSHLSPRRLHPSRSSSAFSTPPASRSSAYSNTGGSPLPPPALSPPPPPVPSSAVPSRPAGPQRSDTLLSIASSNTRRKQRSTALDALEGRGGLASSSSSSAAKSSSRSKSTDSQEQQRGSKGLGALKEEARERMGLGEMGRERKARRREGGVRESRPFLDLDLSSESEEVEVDEADEGVGGGEGERPKLGGMEWGGSDRSMMTVQRGSGSTDLPELGGSSRATMSISRSSSASTVSDESDQNQVQSAPPPAKHPYSRPLTPPSSFSFPLPPLHVLTSHTRDASLSSYASTPSLSLSNSPARRKNSIASSTFSTNPSDGGFSEYSSFSATARAFPTPPMTHPYHTASSSLSSVDYRFPPRPPSTLTSTPISPISLHTKSQSHSHSPNTPHPRTILYPREPPRRASLDALTSFKTPPTHTHSVNGGKGLQIGLGLLALDPASGRGGGGGPGGTAGQGNRNEEMRRPEMRRPEMRRPEMRRPESGESFLRMRG
ncbi:hypothetical protein JCM11641_005498 [Rhodosporidiobolus odoratus]